MLPKWHLERPKCIRSTAEQRPKCCRNAAWSVRNAAEIDVSSVADRQPIGRQMCGRRSAAWTGAISALFRRFFLPGLTLYKSYSIKRQETLIDS